MFIAEIAIVYIIGADCVSLVLDIPIKVILNLPVYKFFGGIFSYCIAYNHTEELSDKWYR